MQAVATETDLGELASVVGRERFMVGRVVNYGALQRHEAQVREDLARLNFPPPNWVPARHAPDGTRILDVMVVGAGMNGQTTAYALRREGIHNIRIIDRAPAGEEGPWGTFARMEILRSPKELTGPDLGVASLTFRAWYEALYGKDGWERLYKVWRLDWRDYLLWVRLQVGVQVESRTVLRKIEARDGMLRVYMDKLAASDTRAPVSSETLYVRKLVLALGRSTNGIPWCPEFTSFNPAVDRHSGVVFHSSEQIDFEQFAGHDIAVLGGGASAFDNAARALEAGARRVAMHVRRKTLPEVNKRKNLANAGFFYGFQALADSDRLAWFRHIFDSQMPPPFESVLRCERHAGFELHMDSPWLDLAICPGENGRLEARITTRTGVVAKDGVIFCTGFEMELLDRPELAAFQEDIQFWDEPRFCRFPYLGAGLQLQSKTGRHACALANIHVFNWSATISHGAVSGDIPGLSYGTMRLIAAIARDLFVDDSAHHYGELLKFSESELVNTAYFAANHPAQNSG